MPAQRSHCLAVALTCLMWAAASPDFTAAASRTGPSVFAKCERAAVESWTYEDLLCVYRTGRQQNVLHEARRRLRALGAGTLERPWATLVLAHATFEEHETQAISLYELAAAGFVRSGEATGEVIARQNLRNMYRLRGAFDAAGRQAERAVAAAQASGDSLTIARASVIQAEEMMASGGDIGSAHDVLLRADRLATPDAPIGLRRAILFSLGNSSLYLGKLDEAIAALERHRDLRAVDGSTVDAAVVALNLLNARLTIGEMRPVPATRRSLVAAAEAVLAEASAWKQPAIEAQTHRVLAELLRNTDPDRAHDHLRRCLELEAPLGYPNVRAACLWSLALHVGARDPLRSDQLIRQALSLAGANGNGPLLAYAQQVRLHLVWRTLDEDRAVPESLEALETVEQLRAAQRDDGSRAALFSNWTRDYYWLTGRLLAARPPRLAEAIEVGERLRTRVLLEYLARADEQQTTDSDLRTARERLAPEVPGVQHLGASSLASLDDIQDSLDENEAMLWYSIAPWKDLYDDFGGGSWVVSVTRRAATIHPLPVGVGLDSQVAALIGLLRHRPAASDVWTPAVRQLGEALLGTAVAQLPAHVERLVIVSDGALHRVPFDVLLPGAGARSLGDRFEISVVPSASVWQRLRQSRARPTTAAALVLADPDLSRTRPRDNVILPPLPWARREAHAIASLLDLEAPHVLEGGAASERVLKTTPVGSFGMLHLAAHARSDDAFPERSAVFLAGGEGEDGRLQPGEIAALDLGGRLVVLSACESADGPLLSGEGTLSLARAFFAAGAAAVVATRWPVRDDDAAFVMERLYRALREGDSVGAAVRRARRDAIDAGLPAAAWASIALLGDGAHRPVPRRQDSIGVWLWACVVAAPLCVAGVGLLSWLRMRDACEGLARAALSSTK